MTYSIRSALDSLVTLQLALSITDPIAASVKAAHKTSPNQEGMLEAPCFINIPRLDKVTHVASARGMGWRVRSQLFIDDADLNRAADIVLAFLEKYIAALSDAITLNGLPCHLEATSTGDLTGLKWAERPYTGIEITTSWNVPLEAVTVGP